MWCITIPAFASALRMAMTAVGGSCNGRCPPFEPEASASAAAVPTQASAIRMHRNLTFKMQRDVRAVFSRKRSGVTADIHHERGNEQSRTMAVHFGLPAGCNGEKGLFEP